MPIVFKEKLNDNCIWGIWETTENADALREQLKIKALQIKADGISHLQKKAEWLSSRVLCQFLSEEIGQPFKGIENDDCGCPHLIESDFFVSLSHTARYSVAIIHKNIKVGIDIELIREKLSLVAVKFLNIKELNFANGNLKKLAIYWASKEVLYKIYRNRSLSLKRDISIQDFIESQTEYLQGEIISPFGSQAFRLKYLEYNNYIIAFNC